MAQGTGGQPEAGSGLPNVAIEQLSEPASFTQLFDPEWRHPLADKTGAHIRVTGPDGEEVWSKTVWKLGPGIPGLIPLPVRRPFYERRLARATEKAGRIAAACSAELA